MKEHKNITVLNDDDGKPAFAVLTWAQYTQLIQGRQPEDSEIPHAVLAIKAEKGCTLLGAWRRHLGLTQLQLADKTGIVQSTIARLEKNKVRYHDKTLKDLCQALNVSPAQLQE